MTLNRGRVQHKYKETHGADNGSGSSPALNVEALTGGLSSALKNATTIGGVAGTRVASLCICLSKVSIYTSEIGLLTRASRLLHCASDSSRLFGVRDVLFGDASNRDSRPVLEQMQQCEVS